MGSALEDKYRQALMRAGLPLPDKVHYNLHYTDGSHKGHPQLQVDFAYVPERIAIEIQGGTYAGGVHNSPEGYEADRRKSAWAQLHGWLFLEFTTDHINNGIAVTTTRDALKLRCAIT